MRRLLQSLCWHPLSKLMVEDHQTVEPLRTDREFEKVTYHFHCNLCGAKVNIRHTRLVGGVEAFLSRGYVDWLAKQGGES